MIVLAGSIGFGLATRHRHEEGHHAHSHGGSSHSHKHSHGHSHSHTHSSDHTHSHSGDGEAGRRPATTGGELKIESHIHVSFFGIELTLPDFVGGEPAPLVAETDPLKGEPVAGDVLRLPFTPSFAGLVQLFSTLIAINLECVRIRSDEPPVVLLENGPLLYLDLDASQPLLPPPEST